MKKIFILFSILFFTICAPAQGVSKADSNEIYEMVGLDDKPEYPGGTKEFMHYVMINFRVPEVDVDLNAAILVSFVVERDGSMSTFKIIKDPGYGLADEAIRVLGKCQVKWKPGMYKGKEVRTLYNLPFRINAKGIK